MNGLLKQWLYRLEYGLRERCQYKLRQLKCLLTDHDISFSQYRDEYYCKRCGMRNPEDKITIFRLLNHRYCWLMSKEWDWWLKLDNWLCENYDMPDWWSY